MKIPCTVHLNVHALVWYEWYAFKYTYKKKELITKNKEYECDSRITIQVKYFLASCEFKERQGMYSVI